MLCESHLNKILFKNPRKMAYPNYKKNFFEEALDEENVTLTLVPVNEGIVEDRQREPGVSSTSEVNVEGLPWWSSG